jgi:siroheme synthase-like protein
VRPALVTPTADTPPALRLLPVGLRVEGRRVLVVGAGPVAARKAAALVAQGAEVTVVAPHHSPEMDAVAVTVRLTEPFRPSHLDGAWFAVAATGVTEVDAAVHEHAEARRVWCNAADDPVHCSAVLPAVVRRGDVTVSVATGGRSPAVASWLRRRIEALLDDHAQDVLEVAARVRDRMRSAGRPTEVSGWAEVLDADAVDLARAGRLDELERRLSEAVLAGDPAEGAP